MPQPLAEELKSIPMSSNLGQSLERAHRFAREQSHRLVTLEHLLLSLVEDPEAALILQSANVELARLSTEVSGYLGRLLEDMRAEPGSEPHPDPELLRVVQAAASAAQQSRRRQIDGAIVLAAIVGDGKSPAAGMLKALGMTFEEAIRALQRANTKARLQPPAAKDPPSALQDRGEAESDVSPADQAAPSAPAAHPAVSPPPAAQSAEEILAAARARIQQRSAVAAQAESSGSSARGPAAPAPPPTGEARAPPAREPPAGESLSSAIEAAMEAPTVRRSEAARPAPPAVSPPAPVAPRPAQPAWTPPEPRSQAPGGQAPAPFGDAPQPPPPPRPVAGPAARFPNPPARAAPWPETGERRTGRRAARANGEYAPPHRAAQPGRPQEPPWAPPPQRAALGDRGPLVESIPRRMRERVPVTGEVRITRDKIEALMQALTSATPHRPHLARTLCVRLRAPNGGFTIEAMTPETQWIESNANPVHDDTALWRWTIVPQRSGRGRLLLTLSARTIGADALSAESAPPDRMIDVRVRANYARRCARFVAFLATLAAGALLGHFGEQAWSAAITALKQALGG
jgi:neural Wiskott-Aldrich syndrome protein